jgi:hypothetical protein
MLLDTKIKCVGWGSDKIVGGGGRGGGVKRGTGGGIGQFFKINLIQNHIIKHFDM